MLLYDEGRTLLESGKCTAHQVLTAVNLKCITVPVQIPVQISRDQTLVKEMMPAVSVWVIWLWFNGVAHYHGITEKLSISIMRTILEHHLRTAWPPLFQAHCHPMCKSIRYLTMPDAGKIRYHYSIFNCLVFLLDNSDERFRLWRLWLQCVWRALWERNLHKSCEERRTSRHFWSVAGFRQNPSGIAAAYSNIEVLGLINLLTRLTTQELLILIAA